jgi:hypothetical protein
MSGVLREAGPASPIGYRLRAAEVSRAYRSPPAAMDGRAAFLPHSQGWPDYGKLLAGRTRCGPREIIASTTILTGLAPEIGNPIGIGAIVIQTHKLRTKTVEGTVTRRKLSSVYIPLWCRTLHGF